MSLRLGLYHHKRGDLPVPVRRQANRNVLMVIMQQLPEITVASLIAEHLTDGSLFVSTALRIESNPGSLLLSLFLKR